VTSFPNYLLTDYPGDTLWLSKIALENGIVCAAGPYNNSEESEDSKACYWTTEKMIDLHQPGAKQSEVLDIVIANGEVLAVGYTIDQEQFRSFCYW
jgi:hypothetical protein